MPTGYTAPVQSGEITAFSEFAMNTARGMGAAIAMRDMESGAPMTDENLSFGNDFHVEGVERAKEELAEVAAWSEEDADEAARKYNQEQLKHYLLRARENRATRQRYGAMLVQAQAWIPPTAEHIGFKDYMVEQLEGSMDSDCYDRERPDKIDGPTLRAQKIASAIRDIEYHTEHRVEGDATNKSRITWVRALEASLVDFEPGDAAEADQPRS